MVGGRHTCWKSHAPGSSSEQQVLPTVSRHRIIARSFFPNAKDFNFLFVYSLAFEPHWKQKLWKSFLHESGHVLGLRHESAREDGEKDIVVFGPENPDSVMCTGGKLSGLTAVDVEWTKKFYALPAGYKIGETPIEDFVPK
jgi:hypothetical protein